MLLVLRSVSMSSLPFYVAEEKGFFEREGVKVRCTHSRDVKRRTVQLTVEGETAFFASISTVTEAVMRGWGEVKALCATSKSNYPCIARDEIKSLADLKGKKVMVGGGRSYKELLWICHRYDWKPGKEIEIVSGNHSERANAFADSSIAAVFGRPQYLFWLKKGGFRLLPYPDPDDAWPEAGLATSVKLLKEQPEVVQKVVNAVVMATDFVRNQREQAINVALSHVPYLDREAVEGNYDFLREWYTNDIPEAAIAHQTEVLTITKGGTPRVQFEQVADLSFLPEAFKHRDAKRPHQ